MVINMECLIGMRMMLADNSIDAVVTDPPYGLSKQPDMSEVLRHWLNGDDYIHTGGGFMGKTWDSFVPGPSIWKEVFRVLKPGGHLLAFFGTRTYDLGTLAIRLAGFEIRDQIDWVYGSGFPKSLDVSKATGDEQWEGWGTALKPAHEPICVARKPLAGTVAENVMQFGTGGMNIDNCRIDSDGSHKRKYQPTNNERKIFSKQKGFIPTNAEGRFPANFVHDGSDEVVSLFPAKAGAAAPVKGIEQSQASTGNVTDQRERIPGAFHADSGSAARFFYCAKASKSDRDEGVLLAKRTAAEMTDREPDTDGLNSPRAGAGCTSGARNNHPTVKPTALMQWLVRLVTPPGGKVLDPFTGSGSTGKACAIEGFDFIGFEMDPHYCEIAKQRINYVHNR
ncbi:DNA methyltransferase [Salmonella phage 9NA]|uniref:Putative DNA methylase n=1 Tax=Salmonella phage 9NA TaxID=1113547 RepID=A0A060D598_9CAUD|nr:DNA methyltransferase [Salmonella phage 9NA]AIB07064.1 putative DNA methylase [Salmonella phage 9NA]